MSRSNYSDNLDPQDLARWRGAVTQAIRGRRGQQMLRALLAALDAMPTKALAPDSLRTREGQVCALGALGAARGLDLESLNPNDTAEVAEAFGIARALAAEVVYENDERGPYERETPEARWVRMRAWVEGNITVAVGD